MLNNKELHNDRFFNRRFLCLLRVALYIMK